MTKHLIADLPFLDFQADGFSTRGPEVIEARAQSWVAQTPYGLAILRHREAGLLLRHKSLRQGSYHWPIRMGLTGSFARFWMESVISQEGDRHKLWRRLLTLSLSEKYVLSLKTEFDQIAAALCNDLKNMTSCEFMTDFAMPFAGRANCVLLGLPQDQWTEVSGHAANLGLAMGLESKSYEPTFNASCDALMDLSRDLVERARKDSNDHSYPARLTRAFDGSDINDEQILLDMIVISIFGGVDTTKGQLGFLMALFDQHPQEWQKLRADPSLADQAINEAIRLRPTTTWATREAIEDFIFQDQEILKGTTIHVLAHASATDPNIHDGVFNISKQRRVHFGFGGGAHHCIGHFLARTDMTSALNALAATISTFEVTDASFHPDSGNTSPITLSLNLNTL